MLGESLRWRQRRRAWCGGHIRIVTGPEVDTVSMYSCEGTHSDGDRARGGISVKDTVSTCLCDRHILIVAGPETASVLRTQCPCARVRDTILIVRARGNISVEDTVSTCSFERHHCDSGRVRGSISVEDTVLV